ncbi:MAG: NADH-quinone oxidoreductase subunit L [Anaerolineae bacterium]|nr:NADH-quinone oxidoreductase subunit L [Anaerolineae bacterium]MDK1080750.1 NADH-quinone oxidoreductase subunit L [Anaerolineae bacterium]
MAIETLIIWLIPLPPFLAFFLIILFTNKNKMLSHGLGVGAAILSWLGSMFVIYKALTDDHFSAFEGTLKWLPIGESTDTWFSIGVMIDPLGATVLFFVSITIFMIFLYSIGYHNFGQPKGDKDQPGLPPHGATIKQGKGKSITVPSIEPLYARFFAFLSLFAFGMYLLVVSDNLLTMFVGWEIMGLCSYLLIGFWYGKKSARDAAIKAFMTTRIGDVFMLLGIVFLYTATGTLTFREIFTEETLAALAGAPAILGLSAAGAISLLLFIGTIGKSAQWPLHVWLPDAMEGPTPVSAMIHAATMVSAGVYALIRMFPLLTADFSGHGLTTAMSIIAFIGAFTALFAATIAVAQNDIKRVLAYSTISQLGFMIAALGIGAYVAAVFHLVTHAFFKALLFLGSGSVIHGMEHGVLHTGKHKVDPQNMFNMGGLRTKMPVTFWTFLIGGFALSGFPVITAGFWSKDEILADAWGNGHMVVFITLAIAAFLTAFYTMRQITLTFLGKPRTKEAGHAHETPWTMTVPLVILSVFAIGFGWVGIPEHFPVLGGILPNWFHNFVGHTLTHPPEVLKFDIVPLATSLVVALGGLGFGYLAYRNVKSPADDKLQISVLKNKWYFDEIYDFIFVKPAYWVSETLIYKWIDRGLIDGILHSFGTVIGFLGYSIRKYFDLKLINDFFSDGSARVTQWFGGRLQPIQTGHIQQYMLASLGLIIIIGGILLSLLVQ